MALDLSKPRAPIIQAFYEGMAMAEVRVWERFINSEFNFFTGFLYNVRVGNIPVPEGDADEAFRKMWADINRSRIDAVGLREGEIWIFEVKISAGLGAIGQAISGRILAELEGVGERRAFAAIVTDGAREDVITVAEELSIEVYQV